MRAQRPIRPDFRSRSDRAIAPGLGVSLDLLWIKPRYRANLVNCDILVDSINDPELYEGKLLLSHPYQHGGIALGVAASGKGAQGFDDVPQRPESRGDGWLARERGAG